MPPKAKPLRERLLSKVHPEDRGYATPCWPYPGAVIRATGYGRIRVAGETLGVHRVSYEVFVGPIPGGYDIDHLCRVRECFNPEHLEPVTRRVNAQRGAHGGLITACPHGHAYTPENTYVSKVGHRLCRTCNRDRQRQRRMRANGYE